MGDPGLKGHPLLGLFRSPDGSGEEDLGLAADLRWVGFKRGQVVEGGAYSDAIIGGGGQGVIISSAQQTSTECRLCAVRDVHRLDAGEKAESRADQVCRPEDAIFPSEEQCSDS